MPLISVVITLLIVGVLLWLFETYIPLNAQIKKIIQVIILIAVVLWLLQLAGVLATVGTIPFPHR